MPKKPTEIQGIENQYLMTLYLKSPMVSGIVIDIVYHWRPLARRLWGNFALVFPN